MSQEDPVTEEEILEDAPPAAEAETAPSEEKEVEPVIELTPLEAAQEEASKWRDLAMRATADLENYRKRMVKEKSDAVKFANADLLRGLLPVLDNFSWGLDAARAESESSPIFQGMSMVHKQIEDFLAAEGVETLITEGGIEFDPNAHDAVSQEASDTIPEGTIINQTRKGYRLKDRLLRPAAVIVSSGIAKEEEPTTEEQA